jgi:hypothetical protein
MNEQAQQALANLLSMAVDGLNGAVEFSKAQLPEVVEQLLMWHMVESLIWFSIGGILLLSVVVGGFVVNAKRERPMTDEQQAARIKELRDAYDAGEAWTRHSSYGVVTSMSYDKQLADAKNNAVDNDNLYGCSALAALFPLFFGFILFFSNLEWLKIIIAPKLYLLEYAAQLVK